tara:strand:- start:9024 stop:9326 length:303 start_codon:yes stop_codon:yes gene_type:complete
LRNLVLLALICLSLASCGSNGREEKVTKRIKHYRCINLYAEGEVAAVGAAEVYEDGTVSKYDWYGHGQLPSPSVETEGTLGCFEEAQKKLARRELALNGE